MKIGQRVHTPEGIGVVSDSQRSHLSTLFHVSGVGFEGWYPLSKLVDASYADEDLGLSYEEDVPEYEELGEVDFDTHTSSLEDEVYDDLLTSDFTFGTDEYEFTSHTSSLDEESPYLNSLLTASSHTSPSMSDDEEATLLHSLDFRTASQVQSAWVDVEDKASRLRQEGKVNITLHDLDARRIEGTVVGDTGTYDVMVKKVDGSQKVAFWQCSCPWGQWAFNRERMRGRLCSHALALLQDLQSLEYGQYTSSVHEASQENVEYEGEDYQEYEDLAPNEELVVYGDDDEMEEDPIPRTLKSSSKEGEEVNESDEIEEGDLAELQRHLGHLNESSDSGDLNIADRATQFLREAGVSKEARKNYSFQEQMNLVDEDGVATQLEELDLKGTHYI